MPPRIFLCYSHRDERWRKELALQLEPLAREGLLDLWDDRRIATGDTWRREIEEALGSCQAAVLLVSADFLRSDFILGTEVPALLQRRAEEGLRVFPVLVRSCGWKRIGWLEAMQVRTFAGKALAQVRPKAEREAALAVIAEEILQVCEATPAGLAGGRVATPPPNPDAARLFVGREAELAEIAESLLGAGGAQPVAICALQGMPGVGKSYLGSGPANS